MIVRHIVFYGTLRRAYPKHRALGLQRSLRYVGRRLIMGALFDVGAFPGLVDAADVRRSAGSASRATDSLRRPSRDPVDSPAGVEVELYRIRNDAVLRVLDRYEGFDPRHERASLFIRKAVRVDRLAGLEGARALAWAYLYNGDTRGRERIDRFEPDRDRARSRAPRA